jgi:hypothetical protein
VRLAEFEGAFLNTFLYLDSEVIVQVALVFDLELGGDVRQRLLDRRWVRVSRFAKRRPDGNRIGNNLDRLSTSPNDGRHCANDDNDPNNSTINSIRKQSTTLWRIRGYWCCTPVRIQRTRTRAIKLDDKRNESESCEIYPTLTIHRHRHCNWHLASCRHAPSSC